MKPALYRVWPAAGSTLRQFKRASPQKAGARRTATYSTCSQAYRPRSGMVYETHEMARLARASHRSEELLCLIILTKSTLALPPKRAEPLPHVWQRWQSLRRCASRASPPRSRHSPKTSAAIHRPARFPTPTARPTPPTARLTTASRTWNRSDTIRPIRALSSKLNSAKAA